MDGQELVISATAFKMQRNGFYNSQDGGATDEVPIDGVAGLDADQITQGGF